VAVEPIRIVLDVDVVGDSLTGTASRSDGNARDFTGWLGLLGVLQELLPADPTRTPPGGTDDF